MQIQSRIAGQPEWTEQSAAFDPSVGEFRFTANAPSTNVEVRARYRMIDGLFGPWLGDNIITASAVVEYDTITGTPTTIHDINPGEGTKLDGIEPGATNGAVIGGNVKNPDGTLYVPVTTDYNDIREQVEEDITDALNAAKAGLDADIQSVRNDVSAARGEITQAKTDLQTGITGAATAAQQARDDLASEVTRAKGAEGTLTTNLASVKQTADKATTDISDEITARTNADSALGNRTSTVEAQLRGDQDSGLAAKVRDEATARVNADDALSGRVSTTEAKLNGTQDSAIAAAVRDEATARTNADGALGTRLQTIEADYVTNGGAGSIAQAKVNDEATARSNADSALSGRANTLEAQMRGDQDSKLAANIRDEATARTNADGAIATRTGVLEAATGASGVGVAQNPKFANWSDASGFPANWTWWVAEGNARISRANGAQGGSPYAIYAQNDAEATWGFIQSVQCYPGKWVIEATVAKNANVWSGAGVTLSGLWHLDFVGDPDSNGYTGETADGVVRTFTKLVDIDRSGQISLHAMGSWDGFGHFRAPKYLTWYHLNLRPATASEIATGKAVTDLSELTTRVGREETARTTADSAIAGRADMLEAQMRGDQDSKIAANLRDEATARINAVSAIAGRTSTLETSFTGAGNLVSNTEFATADGWRIWNDANQGMSLVTSTGDYWEPTPRSRGRCLR